ncbi:MAG: hypothetical protein M1829_000765 [Trizodia sp. TS-e1964]|nr:MAG: hypothetical protein M1829_000765 [Trizodia sp. TS-e1964]
MSWDNSGAATFDTGENMTSNAWDAGTSNAGFDGGFNSGGAADYPNGGNGETGADFGGGGSNACHTCGQDGHIARKCPEKPARDCFNCGQPGHNKADCTELAVEREFTGNCRICDQVGHRSKDCPTKPAETCKNCLKEGHKTLDCKDLRVLDRMGVVDMDTETAWAMLIRADKELDFDNFREALQIYSKAQPTATYLQLETGFRKEGLKIHLIAKEADHTEAFTIMDLQGKIDCKYQVVLNLGKSPKRRNMANGWPESPEENLERLADAGMVVDRRVMLCRNCGEVGHGFKSCTQEPQVIEQPSVKCFNCNEDGHRARDCTVIREDPFACRNCKKSGHAAAECTEPRSAEGVECKRCNEIGHFAKDCPTAGPSGCRNCGEEGHISKDCTNPRDPMKMICRNCDEPGHSSKECPKPRDYSRVKCSNCNEMGHTKVRCKQPVNDHEGDGNDPLPEGHTGVTTIYNGYEPIGGPATWDTSAATGGNEWDTSAPTKAW